VRPHAESDLVSEPCRLDFGLWRRHFAKVINWPGTWAIVIYIGLCKAFAPLAIYSAYLMGAYLVLKTMPLGLGALVWIAGRLSKTEGGTRVLHVGCTTFVIALAIPGIILTFKGLQFFSICFALMLTFEGLKAVRSRFCRTDAWSRIARLLNSQSFLAALGNVWRIGSLFLWLPVAWYFFPSWRPLSVLLAANHLLTISAHFFHLRKQRVSLPLQEIRKELPQMDGRGDNSRRSETGPA